MLIKILLIAAFLLAAVIVFRHRQRVEMRAGTRIGALVLFGLAVASIIDPDLTQVAAHEVGVGRGTDLVLYALVVMFTLTSLGFYFRSRESDRRLLELARVVAINQAVMTGGMPGAAEAGSGQERAGAAAIGQATAAEVRPRPAPPA
jgi:hypothetical protein